MIRSLIVSGMLVLLASCSWFKRDGGYYQDDGPPKRDKVDIASIPDAVPRNEPRSQSGNNSYTALGKRYRPIKNAHGFRQRGYASWYGKKFHGRRTASGELYDMYAMTAAHPTLPLPTYVRVTNLNNGQSVVVKVNDRGPFLHNRIIDLSYAAASKLDVVRTGTAPVEIVAVFPETEVATIEQGIPTSPERSNVYVQIAAFGSRGNALHLQSRLMKQVRYPVQVKQVTVAGNVMHRVWVGPFPSVGEADLYVPRLADFANSYPTVIIDNASSL